MSQIKREVLEGRRESWIANLLPLDGVGGSHQALEMDLAVVSVSGQGGENEGAYQCGRAVKVLYVEGDTEAWALRPKREEQQQHKQRQSQTQTQKGPAKEALADTRDLRRSKR